ncbi:MAG: ATP-binding cassette domain-containing protein [Burkholderiales bacterium]
MITLRKVALRRGAKLLFRDADLSIYPGHKIGLTGANGSGKTSLFALLRGDLQPDSGGVDIPKSWVIAHVAQETPALNMPAIEYVLDGDREFRELEAKIAAPVQDDHAIGDLHESFRAIDGYGARSRAARILSGLGFEDAQLGNPVRSFSGGWRMRLNLAQALLCRSDLLLLDEPTNHLDLDAILWIEQWLSAYQGTMILISHDRDFLDNTVGAICHIENQVIQQVRGNYSAFERWRAEHLAQQQAAFVKQQRQIAHLKQFVDRFRAQATKAKQAQSRLKALDRMEVIAAAHVDSPFDFHFAPASAMPDVLVRIEEVRAGYGDRDVLKNIQLVLRPGARIGLLGRNGAGKSSLIKLIAQEILPRGGHSDWSAACRIGYFAQHQLEQLDSADTALSHLRRLDRGAREQHLRDFLGGFGFPGDMVEQRVQYFSGGERARLVLASIVWRRPNLLLLDEPTNHLDIEMRQALVGALQEYQGVLVVVSHDRHLLRTTADEFLLISDGAVAPFPGDLDDYRVWLDADRREASAPNGKNGGKTAANNSDRKAQRRLEAQARDLVAQRRRPLVQRLKTIEQTLERLHQLRDKIEMRLKEPAIYDVERRVELQDLLREQASTAKELQSKEEEWLAAQAELEALAEES